MYCVRLPTVLSNTPGISVIQLSPSVCITAASMLKYVSGRSGIANVNNISKPLKHHFNC